ncbi:MAG TPA: hypothetical protein VJQ56_15175, partial [Blastocatellia bacterium]|nr:hypothetical protein [Blastocatellia bacterium]
LGAGLRALAETDAALDAPARLEAALIKAYREQQSQKPAPVVAIAEAAQGRGANAWMRWAVAAAVVILIAGFALMRRQQAPAPPQQAKQVEPVQQREREQQKPLTNDAAKNPQPEPIGEQVVARDNTSNEGVSTDRDSNKRDSRGRDSNSRHIGNRPRSPRPASVPAREAEVTTPFIALTSESDLMSLDRGQVVRVKLPRTALESFGLPMNQARAGEPVKADVLIGEDGLARAIRFVR